MVRNCFSGLLGIVLALAVSVIFAGPARAQTKSTGTIEYSQTFRLEVGLKLEVPPAPMATGSEYTRLGVAESDPGRTCSLRLYDTLEVLDLYGGYAMVGYFRSEPPPPESDKRICPDGSILFMKQDQLLMFRAWIYFHNKVWRGQIGR